MANRPTIWNSVHAQTAAVKSERLPLGVQENTFFNFGPVTEIKPGGSYIIRSNPYNKQVMDIISMEEIRSPIGDVRKYSAVVNFKPTMQLSNTLYTGTMTLKINNMNKGKFGVVIAPSRDGSNSRKSLMITQQQGTYLSGGRRLKKTRKTRKTRK